jgi:hypothetical protein
VAQWLAYALPCRRFVDVLANGNARLGADVVRYTFTVSDFHRLLLAGLPAHFESYHPRHAVRFEPERLSMRETLPAERCHLEPGQAPPPNQQRNHSIDTTFHTARVITVSAL